eukprot:PITA_24213
MQPDVDGRRAKWIANLIEFNIELKPTKLVRGQGLAKLMAEGNYRMLDMNWIGTNLDDKQTEEETVGHDQSLAENLVSCEWYSKIAQFLLKPEVPLGLSSSQTGTIKLREAKFCIHENLLYWRDPSGILLRCLEKEQSMEVMHQLHSSIYRGHHYWKTTTHKILRDGGPFQQWGLDFIGEINPHSSGQHRWILVANDYFTKWIEAIPTRKADHHVVMKFLTENIFTRFGYPHKLVSDNATTFRGKELVDMCDSMGIKLVHSTSYYLQGNGLTESSNKSLIKIIKKLLEDNKRNWDSKLKFALWADRVTTKKSTWNSPFKLVYGTEAIFPIQLTLPVAKFLQEEWNEENDMAKRISDFAKVNQIRDQLVEKSVAHQKRIKEAFDRKEKMDSFQFGDLVLKWDALK